MSLAFGFALPHWQPLSGGFSPASLFAGGTVAGAWYDPSDLSTMFTTSAGTTPVAMPGLGAAVSVGLMLDKSQGLVLGSELISGAASAYTGNGTVSTVGDTVTATCTTSGVYGIRWNASTISNIWTRCVFEVVTNSASKSLNFYPNLVHPGVTVGTTTGGKTYTLLAPTASGGNQVPVFFINGLVGESFSIRATSIRELPGNHAIAANDSTKRPVLMARVNLFVWSEQFDNSFWNNRGASVSADTAIAPNGTLTADKIIPVSNGSLNGVRPNPASIQPGQTVSWYAKAAEISVITGQSGAGDAFTFDLSTGTFTADARYAAASMTNVGNGWYRCTLTYGPSNASSFYLGASSGAGGSNGFLLWGADLRPANIGANVPAYQRIADANTYDTSGFPLYLFFDGIDDSMYTPANLNLSGTDKAAVFAGVRKLSAAIGMFVELSAVANSNSGSFYITVSESSAGDFTYRMNGSGIVGGGSVAGVATPVTQVMSSAMNFAGSTAALQNAVRINGNSDPYVTTAGNAGSGSFGTYPLFIGSRNNASVRFNGHLHSLIIAGSAVSAGNVSATEQWVAGKTGIVIP